MESLPELRARINEVFRATFGATPLAGRVADIEAQALSLRRYRDLAHLRSEAGDLLASALQLCTECGWEPCDLVGETLARISARAGIHARLGRRLRVGLLGGAFDPVHAGHVQVARSVLAGGEIDEVWLMPCFEHLAGKRLTAAADRLEMCRLAVEGMRAVRVFDYEIAHAFRGETYHLMRRLLADPTLCDEVDFHLIIGQDNADDLAQWSHGQELERLVPFVVVSREGGEAIRPDAWYLRPPHRFVPAAGAPSGAVSSTRVRSLLWRQDRRVEDLLPETVLAYIRARGLYPPPTAQPGGGRVALFPGSFDPPTAAQREQLRAVLAAGFSRVIVVPTAASPALGEYEHAAPRHRAALVTLAFGDMPGVEIDYDDISSGTRSSLGELVARHAARGDIWIATSAESLPGWKKSEERLGGGRGAGWERLRLVVLGQPPAGQAGPPDRPGDLLLPGPDGPAVDFLRAAIARGDSLAGLLPPKVAAYVRRHRLFLPGLQAQTIDFRLETPRLLIVHDDRNPAARALAERYRPQEAEGDAEMILVIGGDGTMLRAIREHWTRRVPFLGLNAGHLGFLMNAALPCPLEGIQLVSLSLPLLRVDARFPDGSTSTSLAYGDAWMERAEGQSAWLRIDLNGVTKVEKVVGDGMLVATAPGSSAYARALGAVPVPIDSPTLTLAGSNIFQPRFWKPMILPASARITVTSIDTVGKRPVRAFVDGLPLGIVTELAMRQSLSASVELAFTREFEPSAKLLESLFPRDLS